MGSRHYYFNYNKHYGKAPSEENSKGFSTWTTVSSCGDLNDNCRTNIDDDNRSDDQSNGDETSSNKSVSTSNQGGKPSSSRCSPSPQVDKLRTGSIVGKTAQGAFYIVG